MARKRFVDLPTRKCVCGGTPTVGVFCTRYGRGYVHAYCPECWRHGPAEDSTRNAVEAWNEDMEAMGIGRERLDRAGEAAHA